MALMCNLTGSLPIHQGDRCCTNKTCSHGAHTRTSSCRKIRWDTNEEEFAHSGIIERTCWIHIHLLISVIHGDCMYRGLVFIRYSTDSHLNISSFSIGLYGERVHECRRQCREYPNDLSLVHRINRHDLKNVIPNTKTSVRMCFWGYHRGLSVLLSLRHVHFFFLFFFN